MAHDRAILVGGPRDGQEYPIRGGSRPEVIRTVEPAPVRFEVESVEVPRLDSCVVVEYRLDRYNGWPSRDDEGRLRYILVKT
jgi:hypothetical protein